MKRSGDFRTGLKNNFGLRTHPLNVALDEVIRLPRQQRRDDLAATSGGDGMLGPVGGVEADQPP